MHRVILLAFAVGGLLILLYFSRARTIAEADQKAAETDAQLQELTEQVVELRAAKDREVNDRAAAVTALNKELTALRAQADRVRVQPLVSSTDYAHTTSTKWETFLGPASLTLDAPAPTLFLFKAGGVQAQLTQNGTGYPVGQFRLTVNGAAKTSARHEFPLDGGWQLRDVSLMWLETLAAGQYEVAVEWCVPPGGSELFASYPDYKDARSLVIITP